MKVFYTERGREDLNVAFSWYEQQRTGLGLAFLDCVEEVIETICSMPRLYPEYYKSFRRALVRRFPFSVFYTVEEEMIVVHAVFDNRQNPVNYPE